MPKINNSTLIFTGGHHNSALAVAQQLKKQGWNIIWIGHKYSMWKDRSPSAEFEEVTQSGISFIELTAGKLYNTVNPLKLIRIPYGFLQALLIMLKLKLKYRNNLKGIVTFGGYLGVPVVISGWMLGLPSISHEQTTSVGWANRLISYFAKKIAISWPSSVSRFPSHKVVLTGLPLRPEIQNSISKQSISNQIYITGGKQGSHVINETVFSLLPTLLENYQIIHQTGSSTVFGDYNRALQIKNQLPTPLRERYHIYKYLSADQTAAALSSSMLVVTRSGAHVTYELAYLKTRCVLIPIPWSSHDEQYRNASVLEAAHQGVILPQDKLNPQSLFEAIKTAETLVPVKLSIIDNGLELMVQLINSTFAPS